jgi:hypothetical protein
MGGTRSPAAYRGGFGADGMFPARFIGRMSVGREILVNAVPFSSKDWGT